MSHRLLPQYRKPTRRLAHTPSPLRSEQRTIKTEMPTRSSSPTDDWSTLGDKRKARSSRNYTNAVLSTNPKITDKFRRPLQLFGASAQPATLVQPRKILFKPSLPPTSQVADVPFLAVKTIKGTRYGASADSQSVSSGQSQGKRFKAEARDVEGQDYSDTHDQLHQTQHTHTYRANPIHQNGQDIFSRQGRLAQDNDLPRDRVQDRQQVSRTETDRLLKTRSIEDEDAWKNEWVRKPRIRQETGVPGVGTAFRFEGGPNTGSRLMSY
jgi:hypothetical protein